MNCDEIQELLSAYALGLLDLDEQAEVNAHLRTCRNHDEELVQLRATSFALDALKDDVEPSPALAGRVASIAEAGGARPTPLTTHTRAGKRRWWLPAAAVLALMVVFAGGWLARGLVDGASSDARFSYAVQGASGELVQFTGAEGADHVTVFMAGFDRLPAGQLYRLYAIRDGEWQLIGQCNTNQQGEWEGDFAFALAEDEEVALTIEPSAAEPGPGDPILHSQF